MAVGGAMVAVAASALPAATMPVLAAMAWERYQSRRVKTWWEFVTKRATDGKQLEDRVLAGLAEDDESVVAGIVEGARAATAAVDLAAVSGAT